MSHSTHDISSSDISSSGISTNDVNRYPSAPLGGGVTDPSTKDVAKDQAAQVGQEAKASGQHVADVAKDQASNVLGETTRQAKDLLVQGRSELASQVSAGQHRATSGLSAIATELRDLADGRGGSGGTASSLLSEASDRLSSAVTWLESREPSDLVGEVSGFARRRPGTFLAIAAGVGLLAGRLTRGVVAASHDDPPTTANHRSAAATPYVPSAPAGSPPVSSAPATSPLASQYVVPDDLRVAR